MSAFLGPIHHWLYNKIQIQQGMVDKIIELGETFIPGLGETLNEKYGVSETRALELVIDESNIHGWLQGNVTRVEYKLAESVTILLKEKSELLNSIKEIFWNKGKIVSNTMAADNASQVYKAINDSMLDGMPCDHANIVQEETTEKVTWKRNTCVHQKYWDEVGGDIKIYYLLRDEFIKGCLDSSVYDYVSKEDGFYEIRRDV